MKGKENFQISVNLNNEIYTFDLKNYMVKEQSMTFNYTLKDSERNVLDSGYHHAHNLNENDTLGDVLKKLLGILKIV